MDGRICSNAHRAKCITRVHNADADNWEPNATNYFPEREREKSETRRAACIKRCPLISQIFVYIRSTYIYKLTEIYNIRSCNC